MSGLRPGNYGLLRSTSSLTGLGNYSYYALGLYWGYTGRMEQMETTIVYWGYIGWG